jgi:hypothetical protein
LILIPIAPSLLPGTVPTPTQTVFSYRCSNPGKRALRVRPDRRMAYALGPTPARVMTS